MIQQMIDQFVSAATQNAAGIIEIASEAETLAGTLANRAVTPAGLQAFIDAIDFVEQLTSTETLNLATDATVSAIRQTIYSVLDDSEVSGIINITKFGPIVQNVSGTITITLTAGVRTNGDNPIAEYYCNINHIRFFPPPPMSDFSWYSSTSGNVSNSSIYYVDNNYVGVRFTYAGPGTITLIGY